MGAFSYWEGDSFVGGEDGEWFVNRDKAARYRHCMIDNGNGTITLTQDRPATILLRRSDQVPGGLRTRTLRGSFPDGQVRVSFEDDMYDPPKRAGYDPTTLTWHWDNIEIG